MSTPTVAHAGRNGHVTPAPLSTPAPLTAVSLGRIGEAIDRLADLRAEKDRIEKAERELAGAVLGFLTTHNLPALRAERFTATVTERTSLTVDPTLFVEAVGGVQPAAPALRVAVERARSMLGDDVLRAISETSTAPVLRVSPNNAA
jgi:hypothetical protein